MSSKYYFTLTFLVISSLSNLINAKEKIDSDTTIQKKSKEKIELKDSLSKIFQDYIPTLHDVDMIKDRLKCIESEITLNCNESVISWIQVYTIKKRDKVKEIIKRSTFYFPIFEEALKRHGMPEEIKYLSIVESALKAEAVSSAAAVGLWQFIPSTGKEYGLRQDWYIDERMDPYQSTDAACRFLKNLYHTFGNWQLAMAAYNCGPGRVAYAIQASGGRRDFWGIYPYLPQETRGYVPAFIAATYMTHYAKQHNIVVDKTDCMPTIPFKTLYVNQFVNIEEFAKQIEVPLADMQLLNSHLKKNCIPAYMYNYPLYYPAEKEAFVKANEKIILEASKNYTSRELQFFAGESVEQSTLTAGRIRYVHEVEEQESLPFIALKYDVSIAQIRVWNRMPEEEVEPNQKLIIWRK